MLRSPWRWLLALLASTIIIGVLNLVVTVLGASPYLGIGIAGRIVAFLAIAFVIDRLVPSAEKLEQGSSLPPLPSEHDIMGHRSR